MIKAVTQDGNLVVLGLSRANCEKLLEQKPIFITPESMNRALKQGILLVAGETEEAIVKELAGHPDVFDFSTCKVIAVPPGGEDLVEIGTRVYDAKTGEPTKPLTPEERSRDLIERLKTVAAAAESELEDAGLRGQGLRVAIFAYETTPDGHAGEVAHISRDRKLTAAAVRRWLATVDASAPKARA